MAAPTSRFDKMVIISRLDGSIRIRNHHRMVGTAISRPIFSRQILCWSPWLYKLRISRFFEPCPAVVTRWELLQNTLGGHSWTKKLLEDTLVRHPWKTFLEKTLLEDTLVRHSWTALLEDIPRAAKHNKYSWTTLLWDAVAPTCTDTRGGHSWEILGRHSCKTQWYDTPGEKLLEDKRET